MYWFSSKVTSTNQTKRTSISNNINLCISVPSLFNCQCILLFLFHSYFQLYMRFVTTKTEEVYVYNRSTTSEFGRLGLSSFVLEKFFREKKSRSKGRFLCVRVGSLVNYSMLLKIEDGV